ncbi:MFS transporter [Nesterenkonia sp. CL21]|uniref:MFS transporter n=1 Tax=Nesterenkonia sp. CL21 TaxID=3064894 RepID=UPI002879C983|nr:MFS transporter [Nesterenkonia sp. CL21]MDS2172392.1 MFS transporter [Nesterenkonia sp. CL21]
MNTEAKRSPSPDLPERERAGVREWLGLFAMAIPIFMLSTDLTVLFIAMPAIGADLAPAGAQSLWMLHIGDFLGAATAITLGLLTRRIGRRRLLVLGVGAYGLASLLAAYATSSEMLIGARALLGVAGGSFTVAGHALLRVMFTNKRQYATAFAIFTAAFMGGSAAGPPLGGLILEHFWWGAVFLINVPAAALLLLAAPFVLPRDTPDRSIRIDPLSVILSVLGIMALIFGLQELADRGASPLRVAAIVLGVALLGLFLRRQARSDHPLLDLALFRTKGFAILLVLLSFAAFAFAGTNMLIAQHLQVVQGLSSMQAGLLLAAPAVSGIIGSLLTPVLQRLIEPTQVLALTLTLSGASALVVIPLLGTSSLASQIIALSAIMLFGSPFMTMCTQMIVTSVPPERSGPAVAVQNVFSSLGNAGGLAVTGSLAMAIYRPLFTREAPSGLSANELDIARDSFGAAAAVAERADGTLQAQISHALDHAFTVATQAGFGLAGSLQLIMALIALLWLRRVLRKRSSATPSEQ